MDFLLVLLLVLGLGGIVARFGDVDVAEVEVALDKVGAGGELRDKDVSFLDLVLQLAPADGLRLDDVADVVGGLVVGPHGRHVLHAGFVE